MRKSTIKAYKKASREKIALLPINKIIKVVKNKKKEPKPFRLKDFF